MITIQGEIGSFLKVPEFVNGLEYETGSWTPSSSVARGEIQFSNNHTEPPAIIVLATTSTSNPSTNSALEFVYLDWEKLTGSWIKTDFINLRFTYATVYYLYTSMSSSVSSGRTTCFQTGDGDSGISYKKYFAKNNAFYPYALADSRKWQGRTTYKWIAVWYSED